MTETAFEIELRDVHYGYSSRYITTEVLHGVTCGFSCGRLAALVGKSGSGKSTVLSLMAGLDVPTSGEVLFRGESLATRDRSAYRRKDVAVIYQSFRLFPLLTALENVMYPMELLHTPKREATERAKKYISDVGLPDSVWHRFPSMLSGGEQQRVAIARALSNETHLLLADEPTGNLDTGNSATVVDILARLAHERGYCVILATHDLAILDKADDVYDMVDGVMTRR